MSHYEVNPRAEFKPGRVVDMAEGVRRITAPNASVMTGPGTNTYLVGKEDVAVIDPGVDDPSHLEAILEAAQGRISRILVTHNHPDHSTGARELATASGAPVLAHSRQLQGVRNRDFHADEHLADGDVVSIGGMRLRSLYTPGHSADHLCFLDEESGLMFAGDHVMEAVTVVILPPDGDMGDYLQSLRRLQQEPVQLIAPGHGGLMADAQAVFTAVVEHRLARERQILEVMGSRAWQIAELARTIYTDVPAVVLPVAEQQVLAHLIYLERQSKVRHDKAADNWQGSAAT